MTPPRSNPNPALAHPHKATHAAFLREFLRNPAATAAIAPSSRALAKRMIEDLDLPSCRSIVEFGPGSGVFTQVMLDRLPHGWLRSEGGRGMFIAVEFNPRMAQIVAHDFPRATVVPDSAANIRRICETHTVLPGELDAVISGLGWASFPPQLTTEILEATVAMLRPGGHFRTFAYHIGLVKRSAWHLRHELNRLFTKVETSRGVWANLPPAFVYRCVK